MFTKYFNKFTGKFLCDSTKFFYFPFFYSSVIIEESENF